MKDIISMRDFDKDEIIAILDAAEDVEKAIHDPSFGSTFRRKYGRDINKLLEDTLVGTLFVENSTRTFHSFRAAVLKTGGNVDGFPSDTYTSLKKGETWADTSAMFQVYGFDALVMRSTVEGIPRWTREFLEKSHDHLLEQYHTIKKPYSFKVPGIIDGGDGEHEHPTQCLLDLYTIRSVARYQGKDLEGLSIALMNDIAHSRTIGSLISVAPLFDWELHFAHAKRFGPRDQQLDYLSKKGVRFQDHGQKFRQAMMSSLFAYHTRPQKERVGAGEDLISIKELGQMNSRLFRGMGNYAPWLMHPKPVDAETFEEISHDLIFHPKNITDMQAGNGLYIRIAVLALGLKRMEMENSFANNNLEKIPTRLEERGLSSVDKILKNPRTGYIEKEGVVIDHIPLGWGRRLAGALGLEEEQIPKVVADYLPKYIGGEPVKDMIKLHGGYKLTPQQHDVIGLFDADVSIIRNGKVFRKYKPIPGNFIEDRVKCDNPKCVTNVHKEHVTPKHWIERAGEDLILSCNYCERSDTLPRVYKENRFIYAH